MKSFFGSAVPPPLKTPAYPVYRVAQCTALAALTLGVFALPAQAVTITYDGTGTSLLATDPLWNIADSLFPAGSITGNVINVIGGTIGGDIFGGVLNGSGTVSGNTILIAPDANFALISINGISGGDVKTTDGSATSTTNSVTINGGMVASVYGGYAQSDTGTATASSNRVTVSDGTVEGAVYGSRAYSLEGIATASSSIVTVSDGTVEGDVLGGQAESDSGHATATGNSVAVSGGMVEGTVYGGNANSTSGNATATGNTVTVGGGTFQNFASGGEVYGFEGTATASNNSVTVSGGTVERSVYGGESYSETGDATANNNTVTVSDGTVNGWVYGGFADSDGNGMLGQANGNTVVITGGTVRGHILGGLSFLNGHGEMGEATGNTVTIHADADVGASIIVGGFVGDVATMVPEAGMDARSGNTLNLHGKGVSATGIGNFETYNFYLSDDVTSGDTLLTLTGTAVTDLTDTKVNVGASGAAPTLVEGDQIVLIDATAGSIDGAPVQGGGTQGVMLAYDLDLTVLNDQLIGSITGIHVTEQGKAFSESWLAGLALANQGADMVANQGMSAAVNSANRAPAQSATNDANGNDATASATATSADTSASSLASGWSGFMAMGGGHLRYATGSHVSMDSFSLIAGVSKGVDLTPGRLTIGGFFEYGYGSYDSYNDVGGTPVNGDGTSHYYGGGVLAHMTFAPTGSGDFYAEASARGGAISNDYDSSDLSGSLGTRASYDSTTGYCGMHVGAGYVWQPAETMLNGALKALTLDTNAKLLWTRQTSQNVTLSTGEQVDFKDADSLRVRLGSRANYAIDDMVSVYGGMAWEYEFNGDADASTGGFSIVAPSLRGGTGVGELGVTLSPFTEGELANLTIGLGVQGYFGKREGVTGSGQIQYSF